MDLLQRFLGWSIGAASHSSGTVVCGTDCLEVQWGRSSLETRIDMTLMLNTR